MLGNYWKLLEIKIQKSFILKKIVTQKILMIKKF